MQLSYIALINIYNALKPISMAEGIRDMKFKITVARNIHAITNELGIYEKEREKIILENAKMKDDKIETEENGAVIFKDKPAVMKMLADLDNQEVEISLEKIELSSIEALPEQVTEKMTAEMLASILTIK